MKQEKVDYIKHVNTAVKNAKREKFQIVISVLGKLEKVKIIACNDTLFPNTLEDMAKYLPVLCLSKYTSRVIKSTLAAETLCMVDFAEATILYKGLIL